MTDIIIRKKGRAGHITLNRANVLNALTWDMCLAIENALDQWRTDQDVALVVIDGAGDRAFCSGGDIAEMYAAGKRGDMGYGRLFWRDEYRLNAKIFNYSKPIVTFLHGFTMGGGVGIGCHGSHRIVCETSQIAMPECSIGLVPDVGGSLILAEAPGHCGEYLGLTGDRMDAGDAIYVGFADHYVPDATWGILKNMLIEEGDVRAVAKYSQAAPAARLAGWQREIDSCFAGQTLADIYCAVPDSPGPAVTHAKKLMARNAPLGMAVATQIIQSVRRDPQIENALDQEFRYTYRCVEQGDFIEGIRAAIIDRDRAPKWQHPSGEPVPAADVAKMRGDLAKEALQWEERS